MRLNIIEFFRETHHMNVMQHIVRERDLWNARKVAVILIKK